LGKHECCFWTIHTIEIVQARKWRLGSCEVL
jgi:hypothetical protein